MNRIVAVIFLIILFACHSFGQKRPLSNTQLADLVYSNGKWNESYPLFVHFDKNIYTNNEKIWFSAYLSKGSDSLNKQDVLTVAVINTLQKKVYLYNKFMIRNGFCSGDIQIPDSIPPGQYQLNAHTNLVKATGEPLASFNQLIQIKRVNQQTITSTLKIVDGETTKDMIKVSLMINTLNGNEKEKPEISYTIGSGQKKVLSANKSNQYIISIPIKEIAAEAPILSTCIKYNKDLIYDNIRLPLENPKQIHVQFSPEGGAIVDSLRSTVGWETTGYFGQPVSLKALLKENNQIIDTLSTDSYGMGRFTGIFNRSKNYTVTLIPKNGYASATFKLPEANKDGITLHLLHGVVRDTLWATILTKKTKLVKILIHDDQNTYAAFDLPLKKADNRLLVAIPTLSRGLYTLSVLTPEGDQLAERTFFANKQAKSTTVIETNHEEYKRRDSVSIKVKVKNTDNTPVKGLISMACVQANRLSIYNSKNIDSYSHLTKDLSDLLNPVADQLEDLTFLDDISLLRGLAHRRWQSVISDSVSNPTANHTIPALTATVLKYRKPVKKPIELMTFNLKTANVVLTDKFGKVQFTAHDLLTAPGIKLKLSVNVPNKEDYNILINDPDTIMMNWILKNDVKYIDRKPIGYNHDEELNIKGLDHTTQLNEVTIKASHNNFIYGGKPYGSNECGDYVDQSGYLNWPGSAYKITNVPPVKGQTYIDGKRYTRPNGQIDDYINLGTWGDATFSVAHITYQGCTTDADKLFTEVDGIKTKEEFYPLNKEQLSSSEPQYLSTIFWRSNIVLDNNGEATISFATGDITGPFKIIVQGVQSDDVIYGEKLLMVK